MVKNLGGKHAKRGARFNAPTLFRPPKESGELIAVVEKNIGNGLIQVKCMDGISRMCRLRKKFTGRERSSIHIDSWLLVGLRSFETNDKNCDLLEVYSETDVQRLMNMDGQWSVFGRKETDDFDDLEAVEAVPDTIETFDFDINIDDI